VSGQTNGSASPERCAGVTAPWKRQNRRHSAEQDTLEFCVQRSRMGLPPPVKLQRTVALAAFFFGCAASWQQNPAYGQTPLNERVLVVYSSDAGSRAVARHYMERRGIPKKNECRIGAGSDTAVNEDEFERRVKMPVRKCLETIGKQKILYIVFSYRTPYVLTLRGRILALDQFVADIWDEYGGFRPGNEVGPHPYFGSAQSQGNAYSPFIPFATYRDQPHALNIYSVWRLDATDADLAKGLVNRAMLAETNGLRGNGCFDLQYGGIDQLPDTGSASGDWDIHKAAELARRAGFPVIEDDKSAEFGTPPAPLRCEGAALYAGWYSLNHYNDAFTWNPGAIGFHLDSASAMDPRGGTNWSANAVIKGITATSGAVAEPYVAGLAHPDQFFLYLFQGANVGDALLRSTQWLKWMIINIGDPLYRPFPHGVAPFNSPAHHETFLAFTPQSLIGGGSSSGLIGLASPAPQGGMTVSIKSDLPDIVIVPPKITISAATSGSKFPIITRAVTSETAVRVSIVMGDASWSNTLVLYGASRQ